MKYESTWESIDKRPVPSWFEDAKFGIFIHWGIYSVPAYAGKGRFSEWYAHAINDENSPEYRHHLEKYGANFKYQDFVKGFDARFFDADEWAKLFEDAGAKYINFVSKHHDGYCMYKSDYAWNWNSADTGPHRDFCRELKDALDKTDVKFGVYHSIYEWYNPLFLENPENYAVKHLIPMLKELIEKYQPYTLFTDGEWEYESAVWHSTEFLSWLYNESSVKDFIVPNDRWGKETRGRHGGNFTTEYGTVDASFSFEDEYAIPKVFEECRGIGGSFGINKIETVPDYMSAKELIIMLVDLVSRGGNFLLDVGPDADGTIPVIMQERLLQIGKWLKTNGEGIYCSRRYRKSSNGDICYTVRDGRIYAFLKRFPFGEALLNEVDYTPSMKATLLGSDAEIKVENANGKAKLVFPAINPDTLESEYVYAFRIEK